jgi:ADP-heptose:LPS heptosyltransferase
MTFIVHSRVFIGKIEWSAGKMNPNFMRKVDYFLGVPICFFLSLLNAVLPRRKANQNNKILLLQISEMGSTVHAYSSIKCIKTRYPKAKIFYLVFEEMKESINLLSVLPKSNVLTIRGKSGVGLVADSLRVVWFLRKEGIDVAIDFELFARYSSILSYLSGAKRMVGFHKFAMEGLYRGSFLTHKVIYNHTLPISINFLSLAYSLDAPEGELPMVKRRIEKNQVAVPKIRSGEREKELIWRKLKRANKDISGNGKIVILNPNASQLLPLRRWPLTSYIGLAKRILANHDAFVVITGVLSEKEDSKAICDAVQNKRCIDFTGETSLSELIDLYNISEVMVSNDSGPPNFASLTNMRTIVLFGPETPLCYAPLGANVETIYAGFACSPCVSAYNHRKSYCTDNKCMKAISVDLVYAQVRKHLH